MLAEHLSIRANNERMTYPPNEREAAVIPIETPTANLNFDLRNYDSVFAAIRCQTINRFVATAFLSNIVALAVATRFSSHTRESTWTIFTQRIAVYVFVQTPFATLDPNGFSGERLQSDATIVNQLPYLDAG